MAARISRWATQLASEVSRGRVDMIDSSPLSVSGKGR
jgi:hypothetical protein